MEDDHQGKPIELKIYFKDLENCKKKIEQDIQCNYEQSLDEYCENCLKQVKTEHRAEWEMIGEVQWEIS